MWQYAKNEEEAFLAYHFFSHRNLFPAVANRMPSGCDDYYSWLRNNCVIISVDDPNHNALLEYLDQFIKTVNQGEVCHYRA